MLFNNAINTSVHFCYFRYMLRAKFDSWEWKVIIISSQFLYTDETILHQ